MRAVILGSLLVLVPAAAQEPAPASDTTTYCVQLASETDIEADPGNVGVGVGAWAVLDGPGEVLMSRQPEDWTSWREPPARLSDITLAVRLPEARAVTGRIFLASGTPGEKPLLFRIAADSFSPSGRNAFLLAERDACQARLDAGAAGAAWWRHCVTAASHELGEPVPVPRRLFGEPPSDVEDSFNLFSGGRAVAENLQLDRSLPATPDAEDGELRDVAGVPGISVAAYDWSAQIAGKSPALDPLAPLVPADQHAVFFPSFAALMTMGDSLARQDTLLMQLLETAASGSGTRARYERQLGLPLSEVARLLGPEVIRSVALTGSDPDLRSGTDVALLFEARQPDVLLGLMHLRQASATANEPEAETLTGREGDVEWTARVSPGREVCSYVARLGDAIVVTNSLVQLRNLIATHSGKTPSLASLPEFAFFRDRYALGDAQETALLVLSDATIRRWCGPRWRIGASRRVRAEAELAELQAQFAEAAARGEPAAPGEIADPPPGLGTVVRGKDGVRSSIYGTLGFLTPIAELDLAQVSEAEAGLYGRWRDGYQRNWSGVFDPIAARFELRSMRDEQRLALDLTVRPLIASSDYREYIDMSRGSQIAPLACDPHPGALLQIALALDSKSALFSRETSMLKMMLPQADPLGWLGSSVSVYFDDDPFWAECFAAPDMEDFLSERGYRMPVALHVEVKDSLLLAAALVALRGMADMAAPGMTMWETGTYRDEPFVTIKPTPSAVANEGLPEGLSLRYSASAAGLLLTTDQALLERALARRIERRAAPADAAPARPWLGRHLCARMDGKLLPLLEAVVRENSVHPLSRTTFANIPILNEWRRLFPGEDPVATHERLWHRRLTCPGGGTYRWNEEWQTMESSVYGHPGAPIDGPLLPPALRRITGADTGITFEDDGLRARVELTQSAN